MDFAGRDSEIEEWIKCADVASGKLYYLNFRTRDSLWHTPDTIAERDRLRHKIRTCRVRRMMLRSQFADGLDPRAESYLPSVLDEPLFLSTRFWNGGRHCRTDVVRLLHRVESGSAKAACFLARV